VAASGPASASGRKLVALDDLQRQLQSRQAEVDALKEKLAAATSRRNGRHHHVPPSKQNGGAPTAELFITCAEQARAATRAYAGHLAHLMRAAGLELAAATRSLTKIQCPPRSWPSTRWRRLPRAPSSAASSTSPSTWTPCSARARRRQRRPALVGFYLDGFYLDGLFCASTSPVQWAALVGGSGARLPQSATEMEENATGWLAMEN
jgi:hypothetical protein